MKTNTLKRTICASLAGLMLALASCTSEEPTQPANNGSGQNNGTNSQVVHEYPQYPDAALSTQPLSAEMLEKSDTAPDASFYDSYRSYAADLFRQSCADEIRDGKNVMVSPESVMMALGMTANGAKGETLSQMETALGGMGIADINTAMQYRMNRFNASDKVKFNVGNSVWVRDDAGRIQIAQDFCDNVKRIYNADTFLAPFDNTTLDDINGWVNSNTDGMIPQILDEIPPDAVAYLINAMAFEGEWAEKYEDSQIFEDDTFTNSKGEKETVSMMYSSEDNYFEDENTTGFIKYYSGDEYAFMAMLPSEGTDLADYVSDMDGEKLSKLWSSASGDVNVCIPEFSFDYSNELSDELKAMGMEAPFGDGADFSAMAETSSGALYIDKVIHKTHIEVDREGTKAAAATAVQMVDECCIAETEEPKTVYLNRPFAYAIIDTESGTPIFIGAVNTVK